MMRLVWDETKRLSNLHKPHLDFVDVAELFQHPYIRRVDSRKGYRVTHWIAYGLILYAQRGNVIGVISLRKGNRLELAFYTHHVNSSSW